MFSYVCCSCNYPVRRIWFCSAFRSRLVACLPACLPACLLCRLLWLVCLLLVCCYLLLVYHVRRLGNFLVVMRPYNVSFLKWSDKLFSCVICDRVIVSERNDVMTTFRSRDAQALAAINVVISRTLKELFSSAWLWGRCVFFLALD